MFFLKKMSGWSPVPGRSRRRPFLKITLNLTSLRTAYHFEVIFRAEAGGGAIFSTTINMLSNFGIAFRAEGAKKIVNGKVPK